VFFAFLGFDVVAAVAREVQDPQHVVPRAILTVILICVAVYVLMALAVTGLIPYADLDVPNPITFALAQLTSGLLGASVGLGTIVGLTSGIFSILFAQARVFLVMSQDRLLPATLSTLSKRSGAPKVATGTAGVIAAILAGVFPINVLSELISIGTLAIFVMVCVGIFVLRMNALTVVRTIRAYRILLVPVAGILGCLFMMVSLPRETWQRFAVWLAIGILIFSASRLVQRQRRRLAASRADLSLRCE
jgi:APA family basic amino acid/polyamine antiporter